ncbi:MAG: sigma-70 family RNA polymerase sigma factor [Gammaproteobacteria bacterium]
MTAAKSELDLRREFERLSQRLRPDLYRYAFWLGRDRQLAEDVVQEAMLRAWKAYGNLADPGSAKAWMISIVRREFARTFERKRLETVDIADYEEQLASVVDDPRVEEMRQAIFELEADYREPLALQVLMGHTTREIAGFMDLSEGAVLTRLHRARAKLRLAIGSEQPGDGNEQS